MSSNSSDPCPFGPEYQRHWDMRYSLMSRFDEARVDARGLYTMMAERPGMHLAEKVRGQRVLDLCSGVGAMSICYARRGKSVIGIELDKRRVSMARHNAGVYGVADHIEFRVGDVTDPSLADSLPWTPNTVHLDPPWGEGPGDYLRYPVLRLEDLALAGMDLRELVERIPCDEVTIRLPPNFDLPTVRCVPVDLYTYTGSAGNIVFYCAIFQKRSFLRIPPATPGKRPRRAGARGEAGASDTAAWSKRAGELFMANRYNEAERLYRRAHEAEPENADHLANLAACQLEGGKLAEAEATATRALALAPGHVPARINRADARRQLGRINEAVDDYNAALKETPNHPVVLNKTGACLQLLERHDAAQEHYEAALRNSPHFGLARLNLGLLAIIRGEAESGITQIRAALKSGKLDPESCKVAETALREQAEHVRIQPALVEALAAHSPEPLANTLAQTPARCLSPDQPTLDWLGAVAESCRELPSGTGELDYDADTSHLAYLEACAQARFEADAETLARKLPTVQSGRDEIKTDSGRSIQSLYAACLERQAAETVPATAAEFEACVRYWHATLMQGHPGAYPGQFKLVPNVIGLRDLVNASPPGSVAGTIRHLAMHYLPTLAPGAPRAVFLLLSTIEIHPFQDGNGRTGRFLMNRELEQSGLKAIPVFPSDRNSYVTAGIESRSQRDARIMFECLAAIQRSADHRLAELNHALARL